MLSQNPFCRLLSIYWLVEAIVYNLFLIKDVQWNLYKVDTIGAWKKCPLYGDVRFIEIPPENKYLAQIEERIHLMKQFLFISITQEYKDLILRFIQYKFIGTEKAVDWAEKNIKRVIDSVEKRTKNCTK